MMQKIASHKLIFGLMLLCSLTLFAFNSWAQDQIVIKGLTDGRAILEVDGELVILRTGQSERGIKLISANNKAAVIEVHGKQSKVELDRSINKNYKALEPTRVQRRGDAELWRYPYQVEEGDNQLLSVKWIAETDTEVQLDVEYVYAGNYGETVLLKTATELSKKTTSNIQHEEFLLKKGRHTDRLVLSLTEKAPVVFRSDALSIEIFWKKDGKRAGTVLTQSIPFDKYWKKVRVR